jgi:hypothetical protein
MYINDTRGRSLRMFREIYNPNLVAYSLQIDSRKRDRLSPGDSAIFEHLLMGRTCAGSECSKSSEHLDPRDILVDMTLVL